MAESCPNAGGAPLRLKHTQRLLSDCRFRAAVPKIVVANFLLPEQGLDLFFPVLPSKTQGPTPKTTTPKRLISDPLPAAGATARSEEPPMTVINRDQVVIKS